MKKLIPDEKNWKDKLSRFFSNKGFYVILAVCIIIVAATAIFVTTQKMNSPDTAINSQDKIIPGDENANQADQEDPAKAVAAGTAAKNAPNQAPASDSTKEPAKESSKEPAKSSTPAKTKSTASNAAITFIRPVDGSIMKDYTRDVNTFSESKTLGDIRAHTGLDFKVDKLTQVRAVADGTISLVEDNTSGITVEITHGTSGLKTRYAGLSKQDLEDISCGLKVKANDIIGLVGDPIQSECEDGAHLHFEVLKNGKAVDPVPYLKSSTSANTAK
ncbi:stage II sporulation protein Q [Ruminiclostridium hungatei]|uniref:Stage II sporulation protein Q n=1 Tax=Ruminiclostridium hungatei TaxID=48256 RepID=A0A1V4SLT0_RUMHU|nr:M23 family metallopeptidase [Ruminiclostridium hungatei]OPX44839.1 stage II sporulation protein Q [Ruminiclostridium hungatei]